VLKKCQPPPVFLSRRERFRQHGRAIGKIYGFEFLNLTAEQTQQITENCKMLPLYLGESLGI
jgi:hypothetical protein